MDLCFVVDHSGSIRDTNIYNTGGEDNWKFVIDFMVAAVKNFEIGSVRTNVAAVSFGTHVQTFDLL